MKATLDDSPIGHHDECARLFVLALLGDADAATRLYGECVPPLRNWLACRVPWQTAEEAAHDALVTAFRKSAQFRPGKAFQPWLRTIAWNLAQNLLRNDARRRSREIEYVENERIASVTGGGEEDQRMAALACCVEALPERQRDLLHLRYEEGWSSEAIAAAQGRTRVATAVNLHRICSRLRTDVEKILGTGQRPFQPC